MINEQMRVDPKYLGIVGLLTPGILHISGNRSDMVGSHIPQARIPYRGEHPNVFTGYEGIFADYTFDTTRRKNEIIVLAVVNKYDVKIGLIKPGCNPSRTVIYRDTVTGEISYFDLNRYTSFTAEYGYENQIKTNIQEGDVIQPDVEIYSSPACDNGEYRLGVNANTAYMSMLDTTEDAMVISESMANKLSPLSIETKTININFSEYPINLYGDQDDYRIIPNIGEQVRDDGIIFASRPTRPYAVSDLVMSRLSSVNYMTDNKIYGYPESTVIDIEVYLDSKYDKLPKAYDQIKQYHIQRMKYWNTIVQIYQKYKDMPISAKFNTLVTKAMSRVVAGRGMVHGFGKRPKVGLINEKKVPIEMTIEITTMHRVLVNKGFKISDRYGTKGVICNIKPDHEMPIDDYGFRADICIDPVSVLKRTNIFQLYEQLINRTLKYFASKLDERYSTITEQYRAILNILADINPTYANQVQEVLNTDSKIASYVDECKTDTIKVHIPPGAKNMTKELINYLQDKYQTPVSPVTFIINTKDGDKVERTKGNVLIGAKYIYLLHKYPKPLAPGAGYVNQFHFPMSLKNKNAVPVGPTPIKFGESESRIFLLANDIGPLLRMRCLYGNSSIGPKVLLDTLLTHDNPANLDRVDISTEELYDDNDAIRIAHHMFNTCGIDMQNIVIDEDQADQLFRATSIGKDNK